MTETPAKPQRSNLTQRVLTALVAIPLLVGALYYSEWGYFVVFAGVALLCQREFYILVKQDGNPVQTALAYAMSGLLLLITFGISTELLDGIELVALAPLTSLIFIAKLYKKDEKPFTNIGLVLLGVIYTTLPFALLNLAVFPKGSYAWQVPVGILLLLWASDSGAYFAGRSMGRRKLFERVSPKKTWEGFAGGLVASALASAVLGQYFTVLSGGMWAAIMVIIVVAGTYGDLTESLFKRSLAIKDSGSLLPGHGGFLDRFDGLLIALPFIDALLILSQ